MHGQNIAKAVLISKLKLARRRHFQYRVSCTVCGPWVIRGTGCPILKIASMPIRYTPAMVRTRLEPYSSPVVTGFEPRLGIRFQQNSNPINSPFEPALKRVRNPIHCNPAMTSNPLRRRGGLDFIILKASPPRLPSQPVAQASLQNFSTTSLQTPWEALEKLSGPRSREEAWFRRALYIILNIS